LLGAALLLLQQRAPVTEAVCFSSVWEKGFEQGIVSGLVYASCEVGAPRDWR